MHYYQVIDREELYANDIERSLKCLQLMWKRYYGDTRRISSIGQFGLVPVDRIRGFVHAVSVYFSIPDIFVATQRKSEFEQLKRDKK